MRRNIYLLLLSVMASGCGMMQRVIKSSFPYTTVLVIPASVPTGREESAISTATSFDQNFVRDGNNASRVNSVRIVSAKIEATRPSDYNIGNIASVNIYMSKANGTDEVLVASRKDIGTNIGNTLMLDIDNSHYLDEHVREPNVRVHMIYKLRKKADVDVSLHVVLGLTADAAGTK